MPNLGGSPRSIRKRGWWRALNAGKLWIIVPYKWSDLVIFKLGFSDRLYQFAKVIPDRNVKEDESFITWPIDWVYADVKLKLE